MPYLIFPDPAEADLFSSGGGAAGELRIGGPSDLQDYFSDNSYALLPSGEYVAALERDLVDAIAVSTKAEADALEAAIALNSSPGSNGPVEVLVDENSGPGPVAPNQVPGTAGADGLGGTDGDDVIAAKEGDDTVFAKDGGDTVFAGAGNDEVFAGTGRDEVWGGDGADTVGGGAGGDVVGGGLGNDLLFGGDDADTVFGGGGDDSVFGGSGDDTVYTGTGSDTAYAAAGNDVVFAGEDNDVVGGGDGDDEIGGGAGDDRVFGGAGSDTLYGGLGNDELYGGEGENHVYGGGGEDRFSIAAGSTVYIYDFVSGADKIDLTEVAEVLSADSPDIVQNLLDLVAQIGGLDVAGAVDSLNSNSLSITETSDGLTVSIGGDTTVYLVGIEAVTGDDFIL